MFRKQLIFSMRAFFAADVTCMPERACASSIAKPLVVKEIACSFSLALESSTGGVGAIARGVAIAVACLGGFAKAGSKKGRQLCFVSRGKVWLGLLRRGGSRVWPVGGRGGLLVAEGGVWFSV